MDFSVEVFDPQPELNDSNVQQVFDSVRDRMVSSMSGIVKSESDRPIGTHPGRQLRMQAGTHGRHTTSTHARHHPDMDGQYRGTVDVRLIFAEHRIYYVAIRHSDYVKTTVVAAFLNSFQIVDSK